MEYQDDDPSHNPAYRTDEHGEHIYGYVISKNEVAHKQQDQPYDPIDDEPTQKTPAAGQQEHDHYEYDGLLRLAPKKKWGATSLLYSFTRACGRSFLQRSSWRA